MLKITEMFAFVATDKNGDEGVMGFLEQGGAWVPLVGADMDRVDSLRPIAREITLVAGVDYKILHFNLVGEIEK
jgi:hypothetical protein